MSLPSGVQSIVRWPLNQEEGKKRLIIGGEGNRWEDIPSEQTRENLSIEKKKTEEEIER